MHHLKFNWSKNHTTGKRNNWFVYFISRINQNESAHVFLLPVIVNSTSVLLLVFYHFCSHVLFSLFSLTWLSLNVVSALLNRTKSMVWGNWSPFSEKNYSVLWNKWTNHENRSSVCGASGKMNEVYITQLISMKIHSLLSIESIFKIQLDMKVSQVFILFFPVNTLDKRIRACFHKFVWFT